MMTASSVLFSKVPECQLVTLLSRERGTTTARRPRCCNPSSDRVMNLSGGVSVFACGNGGFVRTTLAFPIGYSLEVKQSPRCTLVEPSPRNVILATHKA